MIIDLDKIDQLIANGNLNEISRQTGISIRTLENYRYGKSKNFESMKETFKKLQKYEEENEIMKVLVDVVELDSKGAPIDVYYDINVGEYDSIKEANKAIEDDYSYFTPRKNTHTVEYLIYKEENDEVLNTIKFEV